MSNMLTKEQVEDLLEYIGVKEIREWKGNKIQFCCPIHGESHPSCGINIDYTPEGSFGIHCQVFHCFSCSAGGSIPRFLYLSMPDKFRSIKEAIKFINNRYSVSVKMLPFVTDTFHVPRYEDAFTKAGTKRERKILPKSMLAPFKSGKETYNYFYRRGFNKEDLREYMIGRDLENKTVTVPIFWENGELAGVIGRYVSKDRPKNSRFKIYNFEKGKTLFLLDKLEVIDNTIIGVESMFDAMMLRKWGHFNVVSTMGDSMSEEQAYLISKRCNKFIALYDNDKGGKIAIDIVKKRLKNKVTVLIPQYYPSEGKDPIEWGELETNKVINSAKVIKNFGIPRL